MWGCLIVLCHFARCLTARCLTVLHSSEPGPLALKANTLPLSYVLDLLQGITSQIYYGSLIKLPKQLQVCKIQKTKVHQFISERKRISTTILQSYWFINISSIITALSSNVLYRLGLGAFHFHCAPFLVSYLYLLTDWTLWERQNPASGRDNFSQ